MSASRRPAVTWVSSSEPVFGVPGLVSGTVSGTVGVTWTTTPSVPLVGVVV